MAREEGKTYEQIARELNISANTVRNHVSEALHEIRDYLHDHGAFTALFILAIKNIL